MGKILSTSFKDSVEDITGLYSNLVDNPFYIFNDKSPSIVTYYNINPTYTSVDPGSKLEYDYVGKDSPIRYNKIKDFILFGFPKIELQNEVGDFGLENEKIEVDVYVVPDTIIPYEGDWFEVEHITDSTWLFQVTDVQKDTLENGANAYKLHAKLERQTNDEVQEKVVENFQMIEVYSGSNIAQVVKCTDYEIANKMDRMAVKLKGYYNDIFFNTGVQTFTYEDLTSVIIYDPYMIEFLIRNEIMDNGEDYVFVNHQIPTQKTFAIDYDKTIFRFFEDKDKTINKSRFIIGAKPIEAFGTIFFSRYEAYYAAVYYPTFKKFFSYCLDEEIIFNIVEHKLKKNVKDPNGNEPIWQNILVKYFWDEDITEDELESINDIDFQYSKDAFYLIPFLIFCLEKDIDKVLGVTI